MPEYKYKQQQFDLTPILEQILWIGSVLITRSQRNLASTAHELADESADHFRNRYAPSGDESSGD